MSYWLILTSYLKQYQHLLKQLILRDIKLKYRRSFLGYLWSILNPLLTMLVLVFVFSNLFRFNIPNYPLYLITGSTLFGFLSESTSMAATSILVNAPLLKKTYVPKYIFPLSRVTSSLVNLLFSMVAILLVMLFTRATITYHLLLTPLILIEVYIFCLGLGLFLSAATVFFRDLLYLWGIFLTLWSYLTPIFYPTNIIPLRFRFWYSMLNPMNLYISQFRDILLYASLPSFEILTLGITFALVSLYIGIFVFRRSQDGFILYI